MNPMFICFFKQPGASRKWNQRQSYLIHLLKTNQSEKGEIFEESFEESHHKNLLFIGLKCFPLKIN